MKPPVEQPWVGDSWATARERKFLLGLNVTPAERLKWLESMIVLAWQTGALPKQRPPTEG